MTIGANEMTVSDQHYNTAYVTTRFEDKKAYLEKAEKLGFEVKGDRIMANKYDIHLAMFQDDNKQAS